VTLVTYVFEVLKDEVVYHMLQQSTNDDELG
jgi:hypothetical protein